VHCMSRNTQLRWK